MDSEASDEAMTKIKQLARELQNTADGYLTRKLWPPSLVDEMQGQMAEITAWMQVIENGGGLFNYNDDGQSLSLPAKETA